MARTFTAASSEKIDLSLGAGASITGAVTLAAIVNPAANVAQGVLSIGTGTATQRRIGLNNTTGTMAFRSGNANQSSTTALTAAEGWGLICTTKAAGTSTPRFHFYKYGAATITHENAGGTLTDSTPATASVLGSTTGAAAFFGGDYAIAGAWAAELTDAQVEALAYSLTAWFAVQPNGLWLLDQVDVASPVPDRTGNGANQSAITGTTVSTSAVPLFSYGAPVAYVSHSAVVAPTGNLVTTGEIRLVST